MRKYKLYSAEFKREAVRLLETGDKTATDVAMDLGIRRNQLYKWQLSLRKKGDTAFPGSGSNPSQKSEVVRLKRELERVTEERDILPSKTSTTGLPHTPLRRATRPPGFGSTPYGVVTVRTAVLAGESIQSSFRCFCL